MDEFADQETNNATEEVTVAEDNFEAEAVVVDTNGDGNDNVNNDEAELAAANAQPVPAFGAQGDLGKC